MNKKKFKNIIFTLGWVAIGLGTWVSLNNLGFIQKVNAWYDKFSGKKFEIREQKAFLIQSANAENEEVFLNNDFELKLLLNPGNGVTDEKEIKVYNNNFVKKVESNQLKYKSFVISEMIPIVWFYFDNENDREKFVSFIRNWQEIHKFILFKNDNISDLESTSGKNPYSNPYGISDYVRGLDEFRKTLDNNRQIVNMPLFNFEYYNHPVISINIGVIESWENPIDKRYLEYFNNNIRVNDFSSKPKDEKENSSHSTLVSMVIGGMYGVDKHSKIFLETFKSYDSYWTKTIEKLAIWGVKIINHSYGPWLKKIDKKTKKEYINPHYFYSYNEDSYFLDYISRRYGIINVISAGNEGEDNRHLISNEKLSFNSVVVGELNTWSSKYNIPSNTIRATSNYKLREEYKNLAKPLVVAPGLLYDPVYNINKYTAGTSFAAPLITGLISNLLKYKENIRYSDVIVPIVKSVLSASAVTPKVKDLEYKKSGYAVKYGAGTADFQKMLEAANNHRIVRIKPTQDTGYVFSSKEINLEKSQIIKVSSSWTFNAGVLDSNEKRPVYTPDTSWWNSIANFFSPARRQAQEEEKKNILAQAALWDLTHRNERHITKTEMLRIQDNSWFTDYDLYLERKDENGKWVQVQQVTSSFSNDELLEYIAPESGTFRYRIYKYTKNSFSNSVHDLIAVTHVVRDNEN